MKSLENILKKIIIDANFNDGRIFGELEVQDAAYDHFDKLYDKMSWGPPYPIGHRKKRKIIHSIINGAWFALMHLEAHNHSVSNFGCISSKPDGISIPNNGGYTFLIRCDDV